MQITGGAGAGREAGARRQRTDRTLPESERWAMGGTAAVYSLTAETMPRGRSLRWVTDTLTLPCSPSTWI